jgi:hypothetical protein
MITGCTGTNDFFMINQNEIIVSFKLIDKNNTIEVVKRIPSNIMYATNPPKPMPDKIVKEVYGVLDGKIQRIKAIVGKHIPASWNDEQIIFSDTE